jgi:cytochrome c-type biogenesis protein CcmF
VTVELGHYCLVLALALALVQSALPVWGASRNDGALMATANWTAPAIFVFLALSFASLTNAYVNSDFSVANVWENSHTLKPLLYKFTGVWGNHEGSMLLWVLILGIFAASVAAFGSGLPPRLRASVLGVQAWVMTAFLLFILTTSNPFLRLEPAPFEGKDLNPILQDIGLAVHPPLLYLGYVGFSITFSFAMATMLTGRIDAAWARWVRPWTLAAWMFLTAGIAMGSYWAYYELGWGGFWFWDPVENASFMPWLTGTALLHSTLVMEKRDALKVWSILLALITFSLSLLGTFLVRSGVLTSVHTFASDPTRGIFILCILIIFIGGSLALFAFRAPVLRTGGLFAPISREGALVFNNLFLTTGAATVLVGTLYPLAVEAITGDKISVGGPFFDLAFVPLMVPLLIAVPIGPLLAWKRGDLPGAMRRLYFVAGAALACSAATAFLAEGASVLALAAVALGGWVTIGAFAEIWSRSGLPASGLRVAARRIAGMPRSGWASAFGHMGLGVTLLGIVGVSSFQTELITRVEPGQSVEVAGYSIRYAGIEPRKGSNYVEDVAQFDVTGPGGGADRMEPAKRVYTTRQMPTTEAAIKTVGLSQLYISPGEVEQNGALTVRFWYKPFVTLIWLGPLAMVLGGAISLSDRRMRVGVPRRSRQSTETQLEADVNAGG